MVCNNVISLDASFLSWVKRMADDPKRRGTVNSNLLPTILSTRHLSFFGDEESRLKLFPLLIILELSIVVCGILDQCGLVI